MFVLPFSICLYKYSQQCLLLLSYFTVYPCFYFTLQIWRKKYKLNHLVCEMAWYKTDISCLKCYLYLILASYIDVTLCWLHCQNYQTLIHYIAIPIIYFHFLSSHSISFQILLPFHFIFISNLMSNSLKRSLKVSNVFNSTKSDQISKLQFHIHYLISDKIKII